MIIPDSLVPNILDIVYDSIHAEHPGKEECLSQTRHKYFWRTMLTDTNVHIDLCHTLCHSQCDAHLNPTAILQCDARSVLPLFIIYVILFIC